MPSRGDKWYKLCMLVHDIGKAVESARRRVGISLDELANQTLLDVDLLRSVERGEQLVSTAKLDLIASALGIDAFALYGGNDVERSLVVLPRYASRSDFQQQDLSLFRRAFERAVAFYEISRALGKTSLVGKFSPQRPGASPSEDGYHCARRVRRELGKITEPLPDGLSELLAHDFDIPVIAEPLATSALQAAMVRSTRNRAAAIVLNRTMKNGPASNSMQSWLVDRVSICHELCHILFDEPKGGLVDVVLDDVEQGKTPIEQRANAFAAEMLIPLHGLKELLGGGTEVATHERALSMVDETRRFFKTPIEIAVNHLYNHGYIARLDEFRKELIHVQRAREQSINELLRKPVDEDATWFRILCNGVREVHDRCLITDGMARAMLELSPGEPLPWEHDQP